MIQKSLAILSLIMAVGSTSAWAEATRVTYPDAVSVELLGRNMLYGIQYDRVLNDDLAAGFGFGSTATETAVGGDTNQTAFMVPAYINYYFSRDQGSLFATAGVSLVTNASRVKGYKSRTGDLEFPSDSVIPQFGLGYENRSDTGFLFRVTGYGLVGKKVTPWGGFAFGFAF